ncbi:MAG TPA: hypothetical protein V6C85_02565, partial [Allocoleopsis sp.]
MFLNKKGKFSCELASETLKDILQNIKLLAADFNKTEEIDKVESQNNAELRNESGIKTHYLRTEDILVLPLDSLFNAQTKARVIKIAEDFIRGNKFENNAYTEFVYQELIQLIGSKEFYTLEDITISDTILLFDNLKKTVFEDISSTKVVVIPVLGASLKQGERCIIGSVEFTNTSDFIDEYSNIFNTVRNSDYSEVLNDLEEMYQKSDLIAQVKIKNRDTTIAKSVADEIMKRVYTLVRLILPRIGYQHRFFGTLGEEYLDTRYSFLLKLNDSSNVTSLVTGRTRNRFSDNELNLLEEVAEYQPQNNTFETGRKWFSQCESIICKYVKGEEVTDFQKRVWTALYWLGETMIEREVNSLIIKYATCLEALFNSREGGISEQISEFTAFVIGA